MRWATDERRLAEACRAVLKFMHRQAIACTWGRADLAFSEMMSLETAKRVWQARLDPRRQPSRRPIRMPPRPRSTEASWHKPNSKAAESCIMHGLFVGWPLNLVTARGVRWDSREFSSEWNAEV